MQPFFLFSRLDMDAYFQLLDAEGRPDNDASEWEQNFLTDMNDLGPFPSQPTFSDDVDVMEAFFCPDQGQYSPLLSSTFPAPLPAPFPSNTIYTRAPEYIPDPIMPISEGKRNDLSLIRIMIDCITAVLQSSHDQQSADMQLMAYTGSTYTTTASDFAVPFPSQYSSAGGDQQQMVPSNHPPVQQPGPSHSISVSDTNSSPLPRGKDNKKKRGSRRKRDAGQKQREVEDAGVRHYRRYIPHCPFHRQGLRVFQDCAGPLDYPSPSSFWGHSSACFKRES